jgi:nucleotide-binding universal stress UspA family protein
MAAIRRILCPVDFSRHSRHAIEQAMTIARESAAELAAMHVASFGSPQAALCADLRGFLDSFTAGGVPVEAALFEGDPAMRIAEYAASWKADLIVMATHGRTGVERPMLGSVTERVLRRARCALLTVPRRWLSPTQGFTDARIVCAYDLSPSAQRSLDFARSLAPAGRHGITAVHVVERLDERTPGTIDARPGINHLVVMGTPWKKILRVAMEQRADVIVIGAHGRQAGDDTHLGRTTLQVVRHATCPVLMLRA